MTTYQYDHTGQRVTIHDTSGTTTYANSLYSTHNGTSSKQIMANGELIATVEGTGGSAIIHYAHTDHLGGTNVTTNAAGSLEQVIDYYPFGSIRTDYDTTSFDPRRKFTGHELDEGTGLYYMKARYQEPEIGRFVSQDPVFQNIGTDLLENPQILNAYSYAANNPIRNIDPTGEVPVDTLADIGFILYDIGSLAHAAYTGGDVKAEAQVLGADVAGFFVPYGTGFGLSLRVSRAAKVAKEAAEHTDEVADTVVYVANVNKKSDKIDYVGITNDLERRTAEHGDRFEKVIKIKGPLPRNKARVIEQDYIDQYGKQKFGGQLQNKINSISPAKSSNGSKNNSQVANPKSKNPSAPARGGGYEGYAQRRGLK